MAIGETISNTRTFLEESYAELQKVTWPDADQLRQATIVVIVFTIAVSAIIWLMDKAVGFIVNQILAIFGA